VLVLAIYIRAPAHHMRVPALRIRVNIRVLSSFIKVWLHTVISSPCLLVCRISELRKIDRYSTKLLEDNKPLCVLTSRH
jgi:hypothetical protein